MISYDQTFEELTSERPYALQSRLGTDTQVRDRLIRIPTGMGKTAGVVLPWLHHRVRRRDLSWPTRLVLTLPMRVLVEQTQSEVQSWVKALGANVGVYPLMGGLHDKEYATRPHEPAILVGTQDMLLSRALMRGYAAARGRWPIDFGLLHEDALWVLDEVQLMGVGLATSCQLAAFRDASPGTRPSVTWWMSATLQPSWLGTVDWATRVEELAAEATDLPADERDDGPCLSNKSLSLDPEGAVSHIAELTADRHTPERLTLVIVNTVKRAREVHRALRKSLDPAVDLQLVHSRFRPHERQEWAETFLSKHAERGPKGQVIVATQVVEAGVDISARTLITDLAPWSSLVQRFGRCARYANESGEIIVAGLPPDSEGDALPYTVEQLAAAREGLARLSERGQGASIAALETFHEEMDQELVDALYPYVPRHVLRRPDLDDLFDTTADLSGADIDISRFVREGEQRDLHVFWRAVSKDAPRRLKLSDEPLPRREELCPIPIGAARKYLKKVEKAWVLSYVDGTWERTSPNRLVPGMTVLVPTTAGGYDKTLGLDPSSKSAVDPVPAPSVEPEGAALERTSATAADDDLSTTQWKSIATHAHETSVEAQQIGEALDLNEDLIKLLELAARWHDVGKAHSVFQEAIRDDARQEAAEAGVDTATRHDLAKAPREAWSRGYSRKGFRHELASALAILALLHRAAPGHRALVGPLAAVLEAAGLHHLEPHSPDLDDHPLAQEVAALDEDELNLLLWLVVTHHGKVRTSWVPTPKDQCGAICGVVDGDTLPGLSLPGASGEERELPDLHLELAPARLGLDARFGRSWTERVQRLQDKHGPFHLAYLEALLRAADVRASRLDTDRGTS